eukprot:6782041-Alexandrium_andersonii.AAC.1
MVGLPEDALLRDAALVLKQVAEVLRRDVLLEVEVVVAVNAALGIVHAAEVLEVERLDEVRRAHVEVAVREILVGVGLETVSYTHLTLPTICSV